MTVTDNASERESESESESEREILVAVEATGLGAINAVTSAAACLAPSCPTPPPFIPHLHWCHFPFSPSLEMETREGESAMYPDMFKNV